MILIDSSVWIDFFHAHLTPQTEFLVRMRRTERLGTPDLVLTEILQGARDERIAVDTERKLRSTEIVTVVDDEVAVKAAGFYRLLRTRGITPRKTIDTLIATRCILNRLPLLYSDRDFDPFVTHLGLRSAMDLDTGVA